MEDFVEFTNIDADDMTLMQLSKCGYGTLDVLEQYDTPRILDLIEMENIRADIEHHKIQEARSNGNGS